MENPRAGAVLAAVLAAAVAMSGCLAGAPAEPKLTLTVLTDPEISAVAGWTVGWAVEVFESTTKNASITLVPEAPAGWNPRMVKNPLTIAEPHGRNVSFLLVDIPADAANNTYNVKVTATLGGDSAETSGKVKVSRPSLNLVRNQSAVDMDYVGFLDTNEVFDTSIWAVANSSGVNKWPDFKTSSSQRTQVDYHPLRFTEGSHQVIKGWETGIMGMALGAGRVLVIPPEDAYGHFVNQTINTTELVPIYNHTTLAAFQPLYGAPPVKDQQYTDPLFGWTVRVVDIDNATGNVLLQNLIDANHTYTPYGVNATVSNLSSASGNFELHYAPVFNATGKRGADNGVIVEVNATTFTYRWQTEHSQKLAPYALYFLIYVRGVAG